MMWKGNLREEILKLCYQYMKDTRTSKSRLSRDVFGGSNSMFIARLERGEDVTINSLEKLLQHINREVAQ
jgi:hypothetical protein